MSKSPDVVQTELPDNKRTYVGNVEYVQAEGATLDGMRINARKSPLSKRGDMRLVWVNEGDLLMAQMHTEEKDENSTA
ncbi:hypothetical protein [Thalassospira xiamenensis]|uniref:Uncharacterized protein n=1 Tax=Thalassospira xiamenensis TaxID=220697 RepID=A0A285TST4_9PROT|nr:hypothetical protein [Thalassospira xiamenensis]SOC26698.1 hypothetical protein SAMN05428964_105175 [Thalassospira xiamenensis]